MATFGRARDVDVLVAGELMPADMIISPVELYDVILGMDWLDQYRVHLDCHRDESCLSESLGGCLSGSEADFRESRDFGDSG
ncbi:hypothetical protein KYD79_26445 [Escherichia coli]|nr:hypothetical protein [Escherichia coli]